MFVSETLGAPRPYGLGVFANIWGGGQAQCEHYGPGARAFELSKPVMNKCLETVDRRASDADDERGRVGSVHAHMAGRVGRRRACVRSCFRVHSPEENSTHLAKAGITWIERNLCLAWL